MGDVRRGYVMLIQGGDAQIRGALRDGVVRGLGYDLTRPCGPPSPEPRALPAGEGFMTARALPAEQRQVVEAEIDRQKIARDMRIAMHREPVDYEGLSFDAELLYGESLYTPGALHWIGEKLLVGYALVVMGFERLFRAVGT